MFQNCEYKSNVYENFKSHKYRKHSGTANVFKPGINSVEDTCASLASNISDGDSIECSVNLDFAFDNEDSENLEDTELKIASVLFKLENIYLVSHAAVDELFQELNYLIGFLSLPKDY